MSAALSLPWVLFPPMPETHQRRRWGIRIASSAMLLLVIIGGGLAGPLRFFFAPDPRVLLDIRHDIRTFERLEDWPSGQGRFKNGGFVPCTSGGWTDSGWCLPAGGKGTLRFVLPTVPESRSLLLRLFFFHRNPGARHRLLVFRDGETTPRLTFDNVYFADTRLDLSRALSGPGGAVVLSFEGDNATQRPDVIVQYFEARLFAEPLPVVPPLGPMILAFALLGVALLPVLRWRIALPLWGIMTVGFALRYYALLQVVFLPLDWDAVGFLQLARKMKLFTATGFYSAQFGERDPLFLFIVKECLAFQDSETSIRLVSFFASLLVILLSYRVGARLFSRPLGLVGASAVALCLPLVRESVRGLRLEVELAMLLVLIEVVFLAKFRSMWLRASLAGIMGAGLSLLRSIYAVNIIPVLVFAFAPWKPGRRFVSVLALLLMIGLWFPHRWNGFQRYGEWSWDSNGRWFANAEFAGQPGWPNKIEMWRDTMGDKERHDPRMTTSHYFFGLHTTRELAEGSLRGLWKLIRHMELIAFHRAVQRAVGIDLRWVDAALQVAGVVGLVLSAVTPALRWIPFMFFSLIVHAPFLYDRGLFEPWRHTYQAFPLIVLGALLTIARLGAWLHAWASAVTPARRWKIAGVARSRAEVAK